jgi:hypothetical protein
MTRQSSRAAINDCFEFCCASSNQLSIVLHKSTGISLAVPHAHANSYHQLAQQHSLHVPTQKVCNTLSSTQQRTAVTGS